MKVSKAKSAEHRESLVRSASRLFQERGFAATGVAEISEGAGLTQGGLYGHFDTKSALAAESCRKSHADGKASWEARRGKTKNDVRAYLEAYLSAEHLREVGPGCPMAAYAGEVRRQDKEVQDVFTRGFEEMAKLMEEALLVHCEPKVARRRSLLMISSMAGALTMARATAASDPELSMEIMAAARADLEAFARSP